MRDRQTDKGWLKFMCVRRTFLPLLFALLSIPAWGKVLVRWTQPVIPAARRLGMNELVISWDRNRLSMFRDAARQGYRVYAEVTLRDTSAAAKAAAKNGFAGIVVDPGDSGQAEVGQALQKLRSSYPKLMFRVVNPNGKQPQMRGQLVINRNGILEATSPTAQPWLDTNLAWVRLEQAFRPAQVPLYSFHWELIGALQQQQGPDVPDYALAVAEAGALDADMILPLHESLETGMAQNKPSAWAMWDQVKTYVRFFSHHPQRRLDPEVNVAVVTGNNGSSYEPLNLMARHNIAFRVLRPDELNSRNLQAVDVVLVFVALQKQTPEIISAFAARGGIAVLMDSHGSYPWQSAQQARTGEHSVAYLVGKGRIIELAEPVTDPEVLAQDVRRLIDNHKIRISMWNALTTIVVLYRASNTPDTIVELLNYAEEPLRVQVQVKGSFRSIRYETPERACCESLMPIQRDGFTEFVVPSLKIAGRLHLEPGLAESAINHQ